MYFGNKISCKILCLFPAVLRIDKGRKATYDLIAEFISVRIHCFLKNSLDPDQIVDYVDELL